MWPRDTPREAFGKTILFQKFLDISEDFLKNNGKTFVTALSPPTLKIETFENVRKKIENSKKKGKFKKS